MTQSLLHWLCVFIFLSLNFNSTRAQIEPNVSTLLQADSMYVQAILLGDDSLAARLIDPELVYIDMYGSVLNKIGLLAKFSNKEVRITYLNNIETLAKIYDRTGIISGKSVVKGIDHNNPFEMIQRFTAVYIFRGGTWLLVHEHANAVEN